MSQPDYLSNLKDPVAAALAGTVVKALSTVGGHCGLALGDGFALLTGSGMSHDIKIEITVTAKEPEDASGG